MRRSPSARPVRRSATRPTTASATGATRSRWRAPTPRTRPPRSFFINVADNRNLDHTSPTPRGWGYAVFGEVVAGHDVVDAIAEVATGPRRPVRRRRAAHPRRDRARRARCRRRSGAPADASGAGPRGRVRRCVPRARGRSRPEGRAARAARRREPPPARTDGGRATSRGPRALAYAARPPGAGRPARRMRGRHVKATLQTSHGAIVLELDTAARAEELRETSGATPTRATTPAPCSTA